MSEAERKRRLSYKERRKKWIFIQGVALILVALLIFASVLIYDQLNKEIYIGYQESSTVKYSVKIPKDAPFYSDYLEEFEQYADENGDLWIPSNHAYPTMAATVIRVDLDYQLNMGTPNVDYEYSYRIYAHPEVVDSASKNKFPMPKTVIDETAASITQSSNNRLTISTPIEIDYHHYNQLVKDFEDKMGIRNATENLIITMVVEVIGSSEVFESSAENTYTINVSIPLNENAFDVKYSTSSGQGGDCKILARKNSGNQHIYRGAAITLGGLELIMFLVFIAYVYLTRNHDVNYSIKVQRLLNSYRSFIQRVVNGFDTTGYQLLEIATFKEMLAIRDTIQLPILMSENTDQTKTQFFIPTNTKILYVFEIKVENYDELYGAHPEWIDDSLIKLDAENIADVAEKISAENSTLATDDIPANEQNQVILNLYAEIEKLRRELAASQEKSDVSSSEAVIPASANGSLKFGHFTAGGCVTINYHEMPDEIAIKEAARMIADDLGERLSSIKNSESETTAKVENVEIADTVSENSEPAAMVEDEAPLNDECIADVSDEETVSSVPTPEATRETVHVDLEHVLNDLEYDDEHGYFIDEAGNPLKIQCRRSFTANIIQSDPETVKYYYSELKNHALSYKGVKARMSWRYEAFKKGRDQLLRMKIRGKSICLYLALDPEAFDKNKYFQEAIDSKMFDGVPMLVKVKSQRGLKRAIELIDAVMEKFGINPNPKAKRVDYVAEHPFEKTKALVEKGLIKILDNDYIIVEPKEHKSPDTEAAGQGAVSAQIDAAETNSDAPLQNTASVIELPDELLEDGDDTQFTEDDAPNIEFEFDDSGEIVIPEGKKLNIHCKRSFVANIIQSNPETVKYYYSELKNYILSFKGVKSKITWRYESFKKGRNQLFRVKVRGKALCLYCALEPGEVAESRYFHDVATAKNYQDVPTVVKIKTQRGLKRAMELVDAVMARFDIQPNPKAKSVDYLEAYPFQKTVELVEAGYVKILSDSYKIKEPKAPKGAKAKATVKKS